MNMVADVLTREQKCLLVELTFAALNFGMPGQATVMFSALPLLINDSESLVLCQILILVGLGRLDDARGYVAHLSDTQQRELLPLLSK